MGREEEELPGLIPGHIVADEERHAEEQVGKENQELGFRHTEYEIPVRYLKGNIRQMTGLMSHLECSSFDWVHAQQRTAVLGA